MTEEQFAALAALSRAFRQADRAGLVFVGMGGRLLAYDRKALLGDEDARNLTGDEFYARQMALGQGERVGTWRTYLDSGGS